MLDITVLLLLLLVPWQALGGRISLSFGEFAAWVGTLSLLA